MLKVHFVGINGSGISGVACISKKYGFDVDGCDINEIGDYTEQLKDNEIMIYNKHDVSHLQNKNIIVVSPALLFKDKYKEIPELAEAKIPIIKWQKFLGDYIMRGQNVIVVAGTHGKTTTTTLISLMLETANYDPTVMIGGEVKEWKRNYRVGKSNYFVCEGDEYDGNFLYYRPKFLLINNLEFEHPECFKDWEDYLNNFKKMLQTVQKDGTIIYNIDDKSVHELLSSAPIWIKKKTFSYIDNIKADYQIKQIDDKILSINGNRIKYNLLGKHNFCNIVSSSVLAMEIGVSLSSINKVTSSFSGSKRRMDLVFQNDKFKIYDDYAHHHTQIKATIDGIKDNIDKDEKLIAILEPHLISRILMNFDKYKEYMKYADFPIITKIYKSREADIIDPNLDTLLLEDTKIKYIENFNDIVDKVKNILMENKESKFSILVMGAGYSYKLTNLIVNELKKY